MADQPERLVSLPAIDIAASLSIAEGALLMDLAAVLHGMAAPDDQRTISRAVNVIQAAAQAEPDAMAVTAHLYWSSDWLNAQSLMLSDYRMGYLSGRYGETRGTFDAVITIGETLRRASGGLPPASHRVIGNYPSREEAQSALVEAVKAALKGSSE